jgi:hypothetical protein
MAPVAVALVAVWVALNSAPALAEQVRRSEWWLPELHITTAQQISQGSGVTIAVLDTGVDAAAPDLAGSVLTGPDFSHSGRMANGPFFGIHGTEIASIIAGHGHGSSKGIIGVAPAAKILSIRVTLDSGDPLLANPGMTAGLPTAIADGIRYATNNGASVIDLPLDPGAAGVTGTAGVPGLAAGSSAEQAAVKYARSKGVILVAPAGDDGMGADIVNYPAAYPGVISVGAFDKNFTKAPFSSHEPYVTLTAAGDGVTAETPSGYTTISSTSAASAVVAGVAALIKSAFPALTPAQVTKSLISSTRFRRSNGRQIGSGYGTVDAARALRAAVAMAEPHGRRADTGAAARVPPVTPLVRSTQQGLRLKLERDAIISLAVLLVLLLPITVFALVRRRRTRDEEYDLADEDMPEPRRLAAASAGAAEQMEFLPSPAGSAGDPLARGLGGMPGTASLGAAGRLPGAGASAGVSPFAGAASFAASRTFAGSSAGGMTGAGSYPDRGGPAAGPAERAAPSPVPRGVNGRARVSGSPPWEPAAKPDSELPWATAPAPPIATPFGAVQPRHAPSAGSLWDAAAANARAAMPGPGPAPAPDADRAADAGEGSGTEDTDTASEPMSLWSPAETTETFPVIPGDADREG